jgi:hypothetical protein
MSRLKAIAAIVAAVAVTGLAGYIYGRSVTSVDRAELDRLRLRLHLVEARAQVLDARVSLYLVNFGEAGRHFAFARSAAKPARDLLSSRGAADLVGPLDRSLAEIAAAQDLASRLSQDANSRAGEAARLLNDVIQAVGTR